MEQHSILKARDNQKSFLPRAGAFALCESAPRDVAFRTVSERRRPEVQGISRLNSWPIIPPVNASYLALRPCPHDSELVWLAGPSPYGSCIRHILPA
jgi:hypothetical protein